MAGALKVQGTLRGYSAWVVEQLMFIKGESLSDITKLIFDRWIDDNAEYLQRFQLNHQLYQITEARRERKVVDLDRNDTG
jgi:hypothetical protein